MIYRILLLCTFLRISQAFLNLFGGGGGCGCGCAPTPSCAPPLPSPCQSSCSPQGPPPSPYYSAPIGPSFSASAYPQKTFAPQPFVGPSFSAPSLPQQIPQVMAQPVQPSVINEVSVPTQQLPLPLPQQAQAQAPVEGPTTFAQTENEAPIQQTNSVQQQYIAPAALAPSTAVEPASANDYAENEAPINPPPQNPEPAPQEPQTEETGAEYSNEMAMAKRQANFELAEKSLDTIVRKKEYEDAGENKSEYSTIAKSLKKAIRMKVLRRAPLKKQILTEIAEVISPRIEDDPVAEERLSLPSTPIQSATETTTFDPKCNSEVLRKCILENVQQSTATSKRKIQKAAVDAIGGRVDVICSMGTFSYIVNTELYCETERNGITCFAFKQTGN